MEKPTNLNELNSVGLVVPTLGERPELLIKSIDSILSAGCKHVHVIGPLKLKDILVKFNPYGEVKIFQEKGRSQVSAINQGVELFPDEVRFVGWLGDDDLLEENSISLSLEKFNSDKSIVATYGQCIYIDNNDHEILKNKSGQWASSFMLFLPNLIPQPGSLIDRNTFEKVGGLKESHPLSFDFELFFELKKIGKISYIPKTVSYFRWHPQSLSVEHRNLAVLQTSEIRVKNLPSFLRVISFIWEPLIKSITIRAGNILTNRLRKN